MSNTHDSNQPNGTPECGAVADPATYGRTFTDPVCHEPAGHTGTHVGVHRDGSRTGFHRVNRLRAVAPNYTCPECGLRNGDDGRECLRCGTPVSGWTRTALVREVLDRMAVMESAMLRERNAAKRRAAERARKGGAS